ncbi:regulator of nonsense transcripts UPF2 [Olea europaea subsp. europaea]|uniref:Regulator of nonsense transcripts UPF2 n=1 Tax=Olea europaea subsp. europaea TaxID=158383 RepID=A0A8S0VPD7_OLEEU|nr:regulator of nonsense transcripts UPF2 [Olea europaea subsp. europaea]
MEHAEDIVGEHREKHDDEEEAVARLVEFKKSVEAKTVLRDYVRPFLIPDSGFLRTLDSSIKRNTAVIKKLKQINEEQREGMMDELCGVNLSKFVSEAATSICDAKLKAADIQAAVQICSLLHQRYKDFSSSLVRGLLKTFLPGKPPEDVDRDKNSRAIFARQGRYLLGLPLTGQDILEEFFKGLNITAEQKMFFRKAFQMYYYAAVELLQAEHASFTDATVFFSPKWKSLRQMEHENA